MFDEDNTTKTAILKYGCLDQPGMKEEILPMFITTTAMKVMVHHNIFQHFTVTNRTVYREATMQFSQRERWENQ